MTIIKIKWLPRLALTLISFLLVVACNSTPQTGDRGKFFKVATEPAFPPFEMLAKSGDGLEGFSIDLMEAVGKEASLKVKFESLPFDGIIPALQSKQVDGAISSITITPERAKVVSFSRPYFKSGLAIAVQSQTDSIDSLLDLKNEKIAVQIGTTGAKTARTIPGAKIITFDSAPLALMELSNGNVKAVINDAPVTSHAIEVGNFKRIKIVGKLLTEEYYGIALPKGSPYLDPIDRALNTLIENGIYAKIYQKWFGNEPPPLPAIAPSLKGN
ncbi:MAG: basic amino acid ABC transporter substrate-binding protein [Prochloraceae cyanobacterium]|nr:basic amino acid ABC transporter substrate-binding protein [Prochloraceae cyanobacterium]